MPDEIVDGGAPVTGADQQPAGTPAPAQQAAPASSQTPPGEKTMVVPHSAWSRIKQEEYQKGAAAALEKAAKDAGYESHAELMSAMVRFKSQSASAAQSRQAATPAPQPEADDLAQTQAEHVASRASQRQEMAVQRNLEKALNERNRYANQAVEARRAAEEARAEVDAVRAEMHLRTVAAGVGVQDIDYAITLLTREVERLTPEEAEQFDERAFFDKLRQSKPLLFGEAVQPANTGIGGGSAPRPPAPNQVASPAAGRTDARKMDNKQYQELLRSRGINPHAS